MRENLSDIVYLIDVDKCTAIVRDAYRKTFKGDWDKKSEFVFHNNKLQLYAPAYTPFMLYGRGPGKMPPQQPIDSWMAQNGIIGSSWAIRAKIAKEGTKGTDFLSPAWNEVITSITANIASELAKAVAGALTRTN